MKKKEICNGLCIDYFGRKAKVVPEIIRRFGNDCDNVIEAFGGTGAFSLSYPKFNALGKPVRRIYNDFDCMLVNCLRAIQYRKPQLLAKVCASNYAEVDLCAWHNYIPQRRAWLKQRLIANPKFSQLELAGRYIWGTKGWIGGGFGIENLNIKTKMPRPRVGWKKGILATIIELSERAEGIQTFCGDFERPIKSATQLRGKTAVLMDPPYSSWYCSLVYACNNPLVCTHSRKRAIELGDLGIMVAWCGYSRFHDQFFPADWERFHWKTSGGYGLQSPNGRGRINSGDECIWFSPACLKP